jgi:hypothetical protein
MTYKREIIKTSLPTAKCHISSCTQTAVYEGWSHITSAFLSLGSTTGRNQFIPVCEAHKMSLIGFQEEREG